MESNLVHSFLISYCNCIVYDELSHFIAFYVVAEYGCIPVEGHTRRGQSYLSYGPDVLHTQVRDLLYAKPSPWPFLVENLIQICLALTK